MYIHNTKMDTEPVTGNYGREKVPNLSIEKKSNQNMQRMGATMTWLMAALWIRWLSLVGTYA